VFSDEDAAKRLITTEKLEQGKKEIDLVVVQLDNLVKDMDIKLNSVL